MTNAIRIIIPNFNKGRYVGACLDSLRRQKFVHWKCDVIDGGSTDESWSIIQRFAARDSRIEARKELRTASLYSAWNLGLARVDEPFFAVLTSDDCWPDPEWLGDAIQTLQINSELVAVAARVAIIDERSVRQGIAPQNLQGEQLFPGGCRTHIRDGVASSIGCYFVSAIYTSIHSLVHRSAILSSGLRFSETVGSVGDLDWYIRLGLLGDVAYNARREVWWRKYPGGVTSNIAWSQALANVRKVHENVRSELGGRFHAAKRFERIAYKFDEGMLRYTWIRPPLKSFQMDRGVAVKRLFRSAVRWPHHLLAEMVAKCFGRDHTSEYRLALARKIIALRPLQ